MTTVSLLLALIALASPAPAEQQAKEGRRVTQALCRLGFTPVKLTALRSGHHLADVTVNGRPAAFIVDTGAGASIVHAPLAAGLGLQPAQSGPTIAAVGAGGPTQVSTLEPAALTLAGNDLGNVRLFASDIAGVVQGLKQITGRDVQGIIGQDQLRARHAIVDVQQSMLYLKGGTRRGC